VYLNNNTNQLNTTRTLK